MEMKGGEAFAEVIVGGGREAFAAVIVGRGDEAFAGPGQLLTRGGGEMLQLID